jgi:hypothetical protein
MHSAGLAALRGRLRWRIARLAAGTAAVAACLLFVLRTLRDERGKDLPMASPFIVQAESVALPDLPSAEPELSDDELLSEFPPGTCTIAEVDGRKMLVFSATTPARNISAGFRAGPSSG